MRARARVWWPPVLWGLLIACTQSSSTFPCQADEMCTNGPLQGVCEDVGYCSFPDHDCPSNQRFGEGAPADLAGQCVEVEDPTTSEATDAGPGTSAGDTSIDIGTDDTGSSSSSDDSTTGDAPGCGSVFEDDFEDGMLDRRWEAFEDDGVGVEEADGVLRVTIYPGPDDRFGGVMSEPRDLRGVVVEAELAPIGDLVHEDIGYWLSIGTEDCSNEIGILGGLISGWSGEDSFSGEQIETLAPTRVRFRVDFDEHTSWEYWAGGDWQTLYDDDSDCALDWGSYALFASTSGFVDDLHVRDIELVWACEP